MGCLESSQDQFFYNFYLDDVVPIYMTTDKYTCQCGPEFGIDTGIWTDRCRECDSHFLCCRGHHFERRGLAFSRLEGRAFCCRIITRPVVLLFRRASF